METMYDLLYARMMDEIAIASPVLMTDDSSWASMDLTWSEIAQLHMEVV